MLHGSAAPTSSDRLRHRTHAAAGEKLDSRHGSELLYLLERVAEIL